MNASFTVKGSATTWHDHISRKEIIISKGKNTEAKSSNRRRKPRSLSFTFIEIINKQIFMKDSLLMYFPIETMLKWELCFYQETGIKVRLA